MKIRLYVYLGTGPRWERCQQGIPDFAGEQQVLFEKIAERTSNIVTVVITGRPLNMRRISERSKAVIVMAWRPGTMGAEAIIDLIVAE